MLSSDVMSSSAYATEEILRILIPIGGLAAFALVTPITLLILAVLAVVTVCYREVVKAYPKAGGSYVVSRDNFGPNVAQVAGAALLISYTITVAVSVAAGTDAIISAVPEPEHGGGPDVGGLRGAHRLSATSGACGRPGRSSPSRPTSSSPTWRS